MDGNKVTVDQNTVKLTKYKEKKMMLYIHVKIKCNIFPAKAKQGMLIGIKPEHQLPASRGLPDKSLCLGSLKQLYHISQLKSNTQFNLLTSTDQLSQNSPGATGLKTISLNYQTIKMNLGKTDNKSSVVICMQVPF